jgi:hypothetical protein
MICVLEQRASAIEHGTILHHLLPSASSCWLAHQFLLSLVVFPHMFFKGLSWVLGIRSLAHGRTRLSRRRFRHALAFQFVTKHVTLGFILHTGFESIIIPVEAP